MYVTTFRVYDVGHWICGVSLMVKDSVSKIN
jgi:hypothetical protein